MGSNPGAGQENNVSMSAHLSRDENPQNCFLPWKVGVLAGLPDDPNLVSRD